MNTNELFEAAQLDALGLLDEQERDQFERALAQAAPAVRAQIRADQERLTRMDGWLPDVDPPTTLRSKVVTAVMSAAGAAPETVRHGGQRRHPPVLPVQRVSRWWRASTIGFATAAVVFGAIFVFQQQQINSLVAETNKGQMVQALARAVGPERLNDVLFDAGTERVAFDAAAEGYSGRATLYYNAEKGFSVLACKNLMPLSEKERLLLVEVNEQGQIVREISELKPEPVMGPQNVAAPAAGMRLAIYSAPRALGAAAGTLLLTTRAV